MPADCHIPSSGPLLIRATTVCCSHQSSVTTVDHNRGRSTLLLHSCCLVQQTGHAPKRLTELYVMPRDCVYPPDKRCLNVESSRSTAGKNAEETCGRVKESTFPTFHLSSIQLISLPTTQHPSSTMYSPTSVSEVRTLQCPDHSSSHQLPELLDDRRVKNIRPLIPYVPSTPTTNVCPQLIRLSQPPDSG